jgi:hypothetical protein
MRDKIIEMVKLLVTVIFLFLAYYIHYTFSVADWFYYPSLMVCYLTGAVCFSGWLSGGMS